jgi:flagellar basal-body rod protein FlgG
MSVQTFYTAATGMSSLQTKLDVISNNLANMETTGFKAGRANFEDLLYQQEKYPGAQDSAGQFTPTGIAIGMGTRVQSVNTDFTQGSMQQTGAELNVAIQGNGFFQIMDPTGTIYYSRAGNFSKNANGNIVVGDASVGRLLQPAITIPQDAQSIVISPEGLVSVTQPNNTQLTQVGQIELASFVNPEGLLQMGQNLYSETNSSGKPTLNNPNQNGMGMLQQGALEASNVEPVTQLIDLLTTQRAFEMNSQTVKSSDELMQTVTNMRRAS